MDLSLVERLLGQHLFAILILARTTGFIMVAPGLGDILIPVRVRLAVSFAIGIVLFPLVDPSETAVAHEYLFIVQCIIEICIGLILGGLLRALVFALQIAGAIAAQATSLAQLVGGAGSDPMPAIAHILTMSGVVAAFSFGLHIRVVEYLAVSYEMAPIAGAKDFQGLGEKALRQLSFAFKLAFTLSVPFLIVALLYNLTLGFINRAMPQLMVALVGAPAIAGGSILTLMFLLPSILLLWNQIFMEFVETHELP